MRFAWRWEGARPDVTVLRSPAREARRTERPVVRELGDIVGVGGWPRMSRVEMRLWGDRSGVTAQ